MINIIVYTDGACSGNQKANNFGGWGAVLTTSADKKNRKEIFGGAINTTNNIMELTAVIKALKRIQRFDMPVEVYVDSEYVYLGFEEEKRVQKWKNNGWKSNKKPVKNRELWEELDSLVSKFDDVMFYKVDAHVGIELNELADKLANKGIDRAKRGEL